MSELLGNNDNIAAAQQVVPAEQVRGIQEQLRAIQAEICEIAAEIEEDPRELVRVKGVSSESPVNDSEEEKKSDEANNSTGQGQHDGENVPVPKPCASSFCYLQTKSGSKVRYLIQFDN